MHPFLLHKDQKKYFSLPPDWKLLDLAAKATGQVPKDAYALTREALQYPIGTRRLRDVLQPADRVAVLIEDITRVSPKEQMLRAVLDELESAGIKRKNVDIIIALGTHRPMSLQELRQVFAEDILRNYQVSNHDCRAASLVPCARLGSGQKVRINKTAHEADKRIGIGTLNPHPMNGFGGGGKIMFPGIADFDSILEHHLRLTFSPGAVWGAIEDNLFYAEIQAAAREAGLDFIVNAVLDQQEQALKVVAGDLNKAHLAGIGMSKELIAHEFSELADISITSSYPYTYGPQIVKPLIPASLTTKTGGCIILMAECREELPLEFVQCFENFLMQHGKKLKSTVAGRFAAGEMLMPEGAVDFNMALGLSLSLLEFYRIVLVSKEIPAKQAERMGFIPADSLEMAFEQISKLYVQPTVNIIPCGGSILPQIKER